MPGETGGLFADWPLAEEQASAQPEFAAEDAPAARPRFKTIDRRQCFLRTVDVEELIEPDHPARAIWERR